VRVLLAFEGSQLQRMEMADKFGQISRFRFFDVIRNPQLDPKLFKFERPQGFDLFLQ
jgi:outer membrane lipoprotein carrier protein